MLGAGLGAGLGTGLASAQPTAAQTGGFKPRRHKEDAWMDASKAAHRIIIDSASPNAGGAALLYANNSFASNKSGYGLETNDLAVIVVLRHLSTPFGYTDAMWVKYGAAFSEILDFRDPKTKLAPTTNLYNSGAAGMSLTNMGVTIPSLIAKNVQFAICNSATRFMSNAVAQKTKGEAEAIYQEFTANLIANSHLVAAGVVAVNRAQEYGYTLLTAI
jgi:intracellular sulfur oxidation DsrE/DsrF family protein